MKKLYSILLAAVLVLSLASCGTTASVSSTETPVSSAADNTQTETKTEVVTVPAAKDIVVLYVNDVHCGIDDNLGYQDLATVKNAYERLGNKVLLVDNGDAIQGDTVGTLSKGEYIIDIMNETGFDVAVPGNHEFDYGMDRFLELTKKAKFPYVSCNFTDKDGKAIFDAYKIIEVEGKKLAFVGICTPKTITSSTPKYFMNDAGEYVYFFGQDESG
ncbi:MAG: metallophosphoesterase, partial [Lachnospiraceae bacterium]|nr:metallophosphoesterase [Lachnospiraceae bacterium]